MQALVDRLVGRRPETAAGGHVERIAAAAVDLVLEIEDPAGVAFAGCRHDDRSGAVAKEHAGRAVLVIEDARHDVCADDQGMFVRSGRHQLARRRERIGERRTRRVQIEPPRAVRADLVLNKTRRAREHHVRRDRADNDHVDVVGRQARALDRLQGGFLAQVGGRHARIHDVSLADADALHDPLVGGVDHPRKVVVGQHPRRHVGRQRLDHRGASADPGSLWSPHHRRESLLRSSGASSPKYP